MFAYIFCIRSHSIFVIFVDSNISPMCRILILLCELPGSEVCQCFKSFYLLTSCKLYRLFRHQNETIAFSTSASLFGLHIGILNFARNLEIVFQNCTESRCGICILKFSLFEIAFITNQPGPSGTSLPSPPS